MITEQDLKQVLAANNAIRDLKQNSDVFCPVMAEGLDLTPEEHTHMCLITLMELGYTITKE
jgi:hypothetical protein